MHRDNAVTRLEKPWPPTDFCQQANKDITIGSIGFSNIHHMVYQRKEPGIRGQKGTDIRNLRLLYPLVTIQAYKLLFVFVNVHHTVPIEITNRDNKNIRRKNVHYFDTTRN
jgi:hypothetical protein